MTRYALLPALFACSPALTPEESEELSETASRDVDDLLRTAENQAATLAELDEGTVEDEVCFPGVGDCELCAGYAGNAVSGTFGVATLETPCGATWTLGRRDRTYTVGANALEGSWALEGGARYRVALSGERDVRYEVTGGREGDRSYDGAWALDELTVVTVGDALESYALDLTYTGFAGHTSRLELEGDPEAGAGTLTVDDEVVCDVTRTGSEVVVSCP